MDTNQTMALQLPENLGVTLHKKHDLKNFYKIQDYMDYFGLGEYDDYFTLTLDMMTVSCVNKFLTEIEPKHLSERIKQRFGQNIAELYGGWDYGGYGSYGSYGPTTTSVVHDSGRTELGEKKPFLEVEYSITVCGSPILFEDKEIFFLTLPNPLNSGEGMMTRMQHIIFSKESMEHLKNFSEMVREKYSGQDKVNNKVTVYTNIRKKQMGEGSANMMMMGMGGYGMDAYQMALSDWKPSQAIRPRSFESVYLNQELKTNLLEDLDRFLSKETQEWYQFHDIPSKRSYLFYGPPGTGKTSTVKAIASKYGMPVYIMKLNLQEMDDTVAINLVEQLPPFSILLIEDIDAIFDQFGQKSDFKQNLTFSGLMNILDGITAFQGQLIIMTTNHKEKVNRAALRTGRIDYELEFGYMDEQQCVLMLSSFYPDVPETQIQEFAVHITQHGEIVPAELQEVIIRSKNHDFGYMVSNFEDTVRNIKAGRVPDNKGSSIYN